MPPPLAARQARSPTATNDTPALDIRHFCDETTARSRPHSSNRTGAPPSELMTSTMIRTPRARATRAISATGFSTPVLVSE